MDHYTVRQARRMVGISQEDMAKKLGIAITTYRAKERYTSRFYYDEAVHFSQITGIPINRIYFFDKTVAE